MMCGCCAMGGQHPCPAPVRNIPLLFPSAAVAAGQSSRGSRAEQCTSTGQGPEAGMAPGCLQVTLLRGPEPECHSTAPAPGILLLAPVRAEELFCQSAGLEGGLGRADFIWRDR